MKNDENIKKIYAIAHEMRDAAIKKAYRFHLTFILICFLVTFFMSIISYYFLILLLPSIAYAWFLPYLMQYIREFETFKWNIIMNHMPDPQEKNPEWIRQMLYLYSKRMKYRPLNDNDPLLDSWDLN